MALTHARRAVSASVGVLTITLAVANSLDAAPTLYTVERPQFTAGRVTPLFNIPPHVGDPSIGSMYDLTLAATIGVDVAAFAPMWVEVSGRGQEFRLVGQWRVEYSFSKGATSALRFDARESGEGTFLSLDANRSNLSPPLPGEAAWTQTSDRVSFSGEIDLPIGNVGYHAVELKFDGKFKSAAVITGEVTYVMETDESKRADHATGTFTATRIEGQRRKQAQIW